MMTNRKITTLLLIIVILAIVWFRAITGAASLSIQPLRQDIQLPPGQSTKRTLLVANTSKEAETVNVYAATFNMKNENYDYTFSNTSKEAEWIQFDADKRILNPGQQYTFAYTLAVPDNAEPGGRYIAIFASISNQDTQGVRQTTIQQQAASLIYLTVSGQVSRQGKLLDYSLPTVAFSRTVPWSVRLQNTGNTHFESTVLSSLSPWPSKHRIVSEEKHLLLPGTIRLVRGQYNIGRWPGIYSVKIKATLGDEIKVRTVRFLYLPLLYVAIEVIGAAALVTLAVSLGKKRRFKTSNKD